MKIAVIGGTQMAISGTAEEVKDLLRKLRAETVESNGSVTKYVSRKENQLHVAK